MNIKMQNMFILLDYFYKNFNYLVSEIMLFNLVKDILFFSFVNLRIVFFVFRIILIFVFVLCVVSIKILIFLNYLLKIFK